MGPVKLPFADSDLTPLVKRYSSSTIVTMLREIARCKTAKLDWVMLCKGTSTGITNPKEYQALWRSIAYRGELDDSFDDNNDSPLEDDSDLEVELDPVPSVSPAVAESISSFVKSDLQQQELEEARLEQTAVQTGVGHQAGDLSTARLQQCAATQGESTAATPLTTSTKVPYSGAANNQADRKRRRLWTPEEDLALIAAVDKCGEGNWTTVLKNHYDFDRSASQLSQRWALIRKRREVQEKAGYGIGSGVSPLASGYKDLKAGTLAGSGSQLGTAKDVGKVGNVSMSIKQPVSSTSAVPVTKRVSVASSPMGTETTTTASASVLETQRVRVLPVSGVSSSWAGPRPQQAQNPTSMRAGASQAHKGSATPEGVRRPSIGSPMYYTSTQTSTVPIDSKYAASRNMGAGVARGGSSHGPDPMIQAAAMAAGARIAPAATAASLLKAAQSGNVVHIGSGGLPRSKLGLTSQAGSGNAGGNPGIVHYIRTGSGGASLAATSTSLQRTSSHHLVKNQTNRSFGSSNNNNSGSGNSSPLSVPTVPAQGSRQAATTQSSKPASLSKRGSSPQQKTASNSTPSPNPSSTPLSAPSSTGAPASNSTSVPTPTSIKSTSSPAPKSAPISVSSSTAAPAPTPTATPALTPKSISTSTPASTSKPIPASTTKSAPASTSVPATTKSAPASASVPATAKSAPVSASVPATAKSAPVSASVPATAKSAPVSASVPATAKSASVSASVPATAKSAPASASVPATAKSTPASASVPATAKSAPASASVPATAKSAPASASIPATASTAVPIRASTSISTPASAAASTLPTRAEKPKSTSVSITACGFNTAGSPGEGTT